MNISNNQKTALYRHFNIENKLLYVGISLSAITRFIDHKTNTSWAHEAIRMEVEWFDSRSDALTAEKRAIRAESPLYNKIHNELHNKRNKITIHKNGLSKLCKTQGWDKYDVAQLLNLSPETVYKMMLENNEKTILENDYKLLCYIAKYG